MFLNRYLIALVAIITLAADPALADTYANEDQSVRAVGHYARARALLIEALGEFEHAESIASPDLLIDSQKWKLSLVSRTEELNKVLDPKPRVTRSGARFKASGLHVQHERTRAPIPKPEPYTVNYAGEEAIKQSKEIAKKISKNEAKAKPTPVAEKKPQEKIAQPAQPDITTSKAVRESAEKSFTKVEDEMVDKPVVEKLVGEKSIAKKPREIARRKITTTAREVSSSKNTSKEEDPAVSRAIEAVIKERLKQLGSEG